jgi:hypothetical protein
LFYRRADRSCPSSVRSQLLRPCLIPSRSSISLQALSITAAPNHASALAPAGLRRTSIAADDEQFPAARVAQTPILLPRLCRPMATAFLSPCMPAARPCPHCRCYRFLGVFPHNTRVALAYCCHDSVVQWPPPAHRPACQLPAPCPHCHCCRFLGMFSRNSQVAASPNLPRRASHPADPSRRPTEKDSVDVTSRNRTSASPSGHWTSSSVRSSPTIPQVLAFQSFKCF